MVGERDLLPRDLQFEEKPAELADRARSSSVLQPGGRGLSRSRAPKEGAGSARPRQPMREPAGEVMKLRGVHWWIRKASAGGWPGWSVPARAGSQGPRR